MRTAMPNPAMRSAVQQSTVLNSGVTPGEGREAFVTPDVVHPYPAARTLSLLEASGFARFRSSVFFAAKNCQIGVFAELG